MWSGMAGMCRIGGCSINSIGSGVLPGVEKTLDQQHRRQDGQPDADPDRVGPALRDQQAQGAKGHELPEADTTDAPDPALASRDQHGPEIDELSGLTPRRPPFFRSHVNRNTFTRSRNSQARSTP